MNIRAKLMAAFGVVIVLALITAAAGVFGLSQLSEINATVTAQGEEIAAANKIEALGYNIREKLLLHISSTDAAQMASLEDEIDGYFADVHEQVALIRSKSSNEEVLADADTLDEATTTWHGILKNGPLTASAEGDQTKALTLATNAEGAGFKAFNETFLPVAQRVNDTVLAEIEVATEQAASTQTMVMILLGVAAGLAVVVSLGIAWFISGSIQ